MKKKFVLAATLSAALMFGFTATTFTSCKKDDDKKEDVKKQVTVKFDANGGTLAGTVKDKTVEEGKSFSLPADGATKEGFDFVGWAESNSATEAISGKYTPKADVTLYAVWKAKEQGGSNNDKPAGKKNHFIKVKSDDMESQTWDTQFWFQSPTKFVAGEAWEVSMKVKADKVTEGMQKNGDGTDLDLDANGGVGTQTHKDNAGGYIHWFGIGNVKFTTEWVPYTNSGEFQDAAAGGDFIAFNLNDFNAANTYYFDDISFKIKGEEQIKNGDCEGKDWSSFWIKEHSVGADPIQVTDANIGEE
jgi:uncharacterized repeat protein (TIGR02543 family)